MMTWYLFWYGFAIATLMTAVILGVIWLACRAVSRLLVAAPAVPPWPPLPEPLPEPPPAPPPPVSHAPWTPREVAALNRYQFSGQFHPFTCGKDSLHGELIATPLGWTCPRCDYRQDWAHKFMLQESTNAQ